MFVPPPVESYTALSDLERFFPKDDERGADKAALIMQFRPFILLTTGRAGGCWSLLTWKRDYEGRYSFVSFKSIRNLLRKLLGYRSLASAMGGFFLEGVKKSHDRHRRRQDTVLREG
jgi:hypothetical protein